MLLGNKERWFELNNDFQMSGNDSLVRVTGRTMDGKWCASITSSGVTIEPQWIDEVCSSLILQFIGEKVTPLILARQFFKGPGPRTLGVENPELLNISMDDFIFRSSNPRLTAPFDGIITELSDFSMGADYRVAVLSLMTEDQRYVVRIYPITFAAEGIKVGAKVKAGDILGVLAETFRMSMYAVGDSLSTKRVPALAILGDGAKEILEKFISTYPVYVGERAEQERLRLLEGIATLKELHILGDTSAKYKEEDTDQDLYDFRDDTEDGLIDPFEGF